MKFNKYTLILGAIALTSCSKQTEVIKVDKDRASYRVAAIGKEEIIYSPNTRVVYQSTEDPYIKAEFLGYANGKYLVDITAKQSCQTDILFTYSSLLDITAINPNPKNNILENFVPGNSIRSFEITGNLNNGSIKVFSRTICNYSIPAAELCLNINMGVLPVKFIDIEREDLAIGAIISFKVADQSGINRYIVQKSIDGLNYVDVGMLFAEEGVISYKIKVK